MVAAVSWLIYAGLAYVVWSVVFRLRYGRSPQAYRWPPRDLYTWVDVGLGAALVGYSAWMVLDVPAEAPGWRSAAGAGVMALALALRMWAVVHLGPHWRMGQDESDASVSFVSSGPYRLFKHPINLALILAGVGQVVLCWPDWRGWVILGVATGYYALQARAEERFWQGRGTESV